MPTKPKRKRQLAQWPTPYNTDTTLATPTAPKQPPLVDVPMPELEARIAATPMRERGMRTLRCCHCGLLLASVSTLILRSEEQRLAEANGWIMNVGGGLYCPAHRSGSGMPAGAMYETQLRARVAELETLNRAIADENAYLNALPEVAASRAGRPLAKEPAPQHERLLGERDAYLNVIRLLTTKEP